MFVRGGGGFYSLGFREGLHTSAAALHISTAGGERRPRVAYGPPRTAADLIIILFYSIPHADMLP